MSDRSRYIAHVEDAEEDSGSSIEGIESTRRYAKSEAPSTSPYKERPNTGKSRLERRPRPPNRRSEPSSPVSQTDSDSTPRSSKRDSDAKRDADRQERRRRERKAAEMADKKARAAEAKIARDREIAATAAASTAKPIKKTRPTSLTQSKTQPILQYRRPRVSDDPSCYGVQQPAVSGMRPRAQTGHSSYYGQVPTPPIANAGWHQQHQPQAPFGNGSYPPPPFGGPPSVVGIPPSPVPIPSYPENPMSAREQHAHLSRRFDRDRPSSSMGFRPSSYEYESYEEDVPDPRTTIVRRLSRTQKQNEEDRRRMPPPPPPRPKSALPPSNSAGAFRPPPPQHQHSAPPRQKSRPPVARSRVGFVDQPRGFDDDDFGGNAELFADASPEPVHDRRALARVRRGSVTYERHGMDIMPARRQSRRSSLYGDQALGTGGVSLEDNKYLDALKYQDDVSGGPTMPLTAETLRKASTRTRGHGGGSSRSTRSSGSHDDSEYKRSNTTGITRSSTADTDNVTIKVSGSAVVRVQGAEIECNDGGEITFTSRAGSSRYGSDKASTIYQIEDSRSRVERKALPHRPRAPSQADSYSRSYAPYEPHFFADDM